MIATIWDNISKTTKIRSYLLPEITIHT